MTNLIQLPNVAMADKGIIVDTLNFWTNQPSRDSTDCQHLALTKERGMSATRTFDPKIDTCASNRSVRHRYAQPAYL